MKSASVSFNEPRYHGCVPKQLLTLENKVEAEQKVGAHQVDDRVSLRGLGSHDCNPNPYTKPLSKKRSNTKDICECSKELVAAEVLRRPTSKITVKEAITPVKLVVTQSVEPEKKAYITELASKLSIGAANCLKVIYDKHDEEFTVKGLEYLFQQLGGRLYLDTHSAQKLKLLSRHYAIPHSILQSIVHNISNRDLDSKVKVNLLLSIKYSINRVAQHPEELIEPLLSGINTNLDHSINKQIVECLEHCFGKLRNTEYVGKAVEQVSGYLEHTSRQDTFIITKLGKLVAAVQHESQGEELIQRRAPLLSDIGKRRAAVTQERSVVVQVTHRKKLESLSDVALNLDQDVSSHVSKGRTRNVIAEILPKVDTNSGCRFKFWWSTEGSVDFCLQEAEASHVLRKGEIEYLADTLLTGCQFNWRACRGSDVNRKITKTLKLVAKQGQELPKTAIKKLVQFVTDIQDLRQKQDGWFYTPDIKQIEDMRLDAISTIDAFLKHYPATLDSDSRKTIEKVLAGADLASLKSFGMKILSSQHGAISKELFTAYLENLEKNIEAKEATDFLMDRLSKQEIQFFGTTVIEKIAAIVAKPQFDHKVRMDCADITNIYVNKLSGDLSKEILDSVFTSYIKVFQTERNDEIISKCLGVVCSATEHSTYDLQDVYNTLVKNRLFYCAHNANTVITVLYSAMQSSKLAGIDLDLLSDALHSDTVIAVDAEKGIDFVPKSEENSLLPSISRLTAEIFYNLTIKNTSSGLETKPLSPKSLECCVRALSPECDKETRIWVARSLRYQELPYPLLEELGKYTDDAVDEIAVNTKLLFLKSVDECKDAIKPEFLAKVADSYEYDSFIIGREDLSPEINSLVLSILVKQSENQECPEQAFKVMWHIFENNTASIEVTGSVFQLLEACVSRKQIITQDIIYLLEKTVSDQNAFSGRALNILKTVIKNGQEVSDSTVRIFTDSLFQEQDPAKRLEVFRLLECINYNQEISNELFDIYELELVGQELTKQFSENSMIFIKDAIKEGQKLSITHFEAIKKNLHQDSALQTLLQASSNGQSIPEDIITTITSLLPTTRLIYTTQATRMLGMLHNISKNNQKLPTELINKLEGLLDAAQPEIKERILSIFLSNPSISQSLSAKSLTYTLRLLSEDSLFRQMHLSILSSVVKDTEITEQNVELLLDVIVKGVGSNENAEILDSVSVFQELLKKRPDILQTQDVEASKISQLLDYTLLCPILKTIKDVVVSSLDRKITKLLNSLVDKAINGSIEVKDAILAIPGLVLAKNLDHKLKAKLELAGLYNKSDEVVLNYINRIKDGLLPDNFAQINKIIHRSTGLQHKAVQTLLVISPSDKAKVTDDLLTSISCLLSSSNSVLQNDCVILLRQISEVGKELNQPIVESLAHLLTCPSSQNLKEHVLKTLCVIKEKQSIPDHIGLLIEAAEAPSLSVDLLQKIKSALKNEQELSEDIISKLKNEAARQVHPRILDNIGTFISNGIFHSDTDFNDHLLEIFENLVLKDKVIDVNIYRFIESTIGKRKHVTAQTVSAYEKIIASNVLNTTYATIESVFCLLKETRDYSTYIVALKCMQTALMHYHEALSRQEEITELTSILEANLTSDKYNVRKESFRILRIIQEEDQFNHLSYQVPRFAELLSEQPSVLSSDVLNQIDTDIFLADVNELGLDSFTGNRNLLVENLFLVAKVSDDEKKRLFSYKLEELEKSNTYQEVDNNRDEVLKLLTEKVDEHKYSFSQIIDIMSFMQIGHEQALKGLKNFGDIYTRLQTEWITKLVSEKIKPTRELISTLSDVLKTKKYGPDEIKQFFTKFRQVENTQNLVKVLKFIQAHESVRDYVSCHEYATVADCQVELEARAITDKFHQSVISQNFIIDEERLLINIRSILKKSWNFQQLEGFCSKLNSCLSAHALAGVFEILDYYDITSSEDQRVLEVLEEPSEKWVCEINKLAINSKFRPGGRVRNTDELIALLKPANPEELKLTVQKIKDPTLKTQVQSDILTLPIAEWTKEHINQWTQVIKQELKDTRTTTVSDIEMLAVIKRANSLHTKFELNDLQILSLLMMLNKDAQKGRLLQIATGEGKSTIISALAAIMVLKGQKVDVVTSSPILAQRDASDKKGFYNILGISVADNVDGPVYLKGIKKCYEKDVVYGDVSQFQFDTLRDEYSALGTLGGRQKQIVVVDEVDSMLIDDSSKIAQLSTSMPGMEHIEPIYHTIYNELWKAFKASTLLVSINIDIAELQKNLQDHIKTLIADGKIQVPVHLRDFINCQLPRWVEHAVGALVYYNEKADYVIEQDECLISRIKPVDFDSTGIVQSSTSWSDGLHQFLQIKHGLQVVPETLTTNFLSNTCYFKKYGNSLYGFTGTLGSIRAREILASTYNIDSVDIPSLREKQYVEYPTVLAANQEEWSKSIVNSVIKETEKNRGVLVICQTIDEAEVIAGKIKEDKTKPNVVLYTMNGASQEEAIKYIKPGEIIVATNLAGRGTDIGTKDIEPYGGMHVCLTFLPKNLRVEQQALGRTSRQGNFGSGQIICIGPNPASLGVADEIQHVENVKFDRDKAETEMLDRFESTEAKIIRNKDKLFSKFCTLLDQIRTNFRNEGETTAMHTVQEGIGYTLSKLPGRAVDFGKGVIKKLVLGYTPSVCESNVIAAVEERWGFFLKSIETDQHIGEETYIDTKYDQFAEEVKRDLQDGTVIKNPYYHTCIAYDELEKSEYLKAKSHFDAAIKLDETFSASSHYGKAITLIKEASEAIELYKIAKSRLAPLKKEALNEFSAASAALKVEMEMINRISHARYEGSDISKQLAKRKLILGTYANNIDTAIAVIRKSQRLIDLGVISEDQISYKGKFEKHDAIKQLTEGSTGIEVTFNDLIQWYDCVEKDEAKQTIAEGVKILPQGYQGLEVVTSFVSAVDAVTMINPNTKFSDCYQQEAIDKITEQGKVYKPPKSFWDKVSNFSGSHKIDRPVVALAIKSTGNIVHHDLGRDFAKDIINSVKDCDGFYILRGKKVSGKSTLDKSNILDRDETLRMIQTISDKFDIEIHSHNSTYLLQDHEMARKIVQSIKKSEIESDKFDLTFTNANKGLADIQNVVIELQSTLQGVALDILKKIPSQINLEVDCSDKEELLKSIEQSSGTHVWLKVEEIEQRFGKDTAKAKLQTEKTTTVRYEDLKSEDAVKIIEATKGTFSIVFTKFDRDNFVEHFANIEDSVKVRFCQLESSKQSDTADTVIDYLRNHKKDFQLTYKGLKYQDARQLIDKAQIKQEEIDVVRTETLSDLLPHENRSAEELLLLSKRGIEKVVHLAERGHVQWRSIIAVSALATVQIVAGVVLVATGWAGTVGLGLISEGLVDLYTAVRAYQTRQFSWKGYAQQKLISVAISIATSGYQAIKHAATIRKAALSKELVQQTVTELEEQGLGWAVRRGGTVGTKAARAVRSAVTCVRNVAKGASQVFNEKVALKTVAKTVALRGATMLANTMIYQLLDKIRNAVKGMIADKISEKLQNSPIISIIQKVYALQIHDNPQLRLRDANVDKIIQDIMKDRTSGILRTAIKGLCTTISACSEVAALVTTITRNVAEIATITGHIYNALERKLREINMTLLSVPNLICRGDHTISPDAASTITSKLEVVIDANGCMKKQTQHNLNIDDVKLGEYEKHKTSIKRTLNPLKKEAYLSDIANSIAEVATSHILENVANIMITGVHIGSNAIAHRVFADNESLQIQDRIATDNFLRPFEQYGLYSEDLGRPVLMTTVPDEGFKQYDIIHTVEEVMSQKYMPSNMLSIINDSMQQMHERVTASDNECVIVLGVTGSGKSTLINYLSSQAELVVNDSGRIDATASAGDIKIGHSGVNSETTVPNKWYDERTRTTYFDTPGFWDSRGFEQEIKNAIYTVGLFKIPRVKICLVIDYSTFADQAGRYESLKEILNQLSILFRDHIKENGNIDDSLKDGFTVVVTKCEKGSDNVAIKEAIENDFIPEMQMSKEQEAILNLIADKISVFQRPKEKVINYSDKEIILKQLNKSKFSKLHATVVLSQTSCNKLKEVIDKVYDTYNNSLQDIKQALESRLKSVNYRVLDGIVKQLAIKDHAHTKSDFDEVYENLRIIYSSLGISDDSILSQLKGSRDYFEFANTILPEQPYKFLNKMQESVLKLRNNIQTRANILRVCAKPYHSVEPANPNKFGLVVLQALSEQVAQCGF